MHHEARGIDDSAGHLQLLTLLCGWRSGQDDEGHRNNGPQQ
jgi:hypothetical protein